MEKKAKNLEAVKSTGTNTDQDTTSSNNESYNSTPSAESQYNNAEKMLTPSISTVVAAEQQPLPSKFR